MSVCTFLVSAAKREFFDLNGVFFDEDCLSNLQITNSSEEEIRDWLTDTDGEFNNLSPDKIDAAAKGASAWMRAHPDWEFVTDQDEAYDEVYLACDDEDAKYYVAEFGDDTPVYKKTGEVV